MIILKIVTRFALLPSETFKMANTLSISFSVLYFLLVAKWFCLKAMGIIHQRFAHFALSFTMQTNTIICLFFLIKAAAGRTNPTLQRWAVNWGIFIAIIWFCALGGNEQTPAEKHLNWVLHYYTPGGILIDWLWSDKVEWKSSMAYMTAPLSAFVGVFFVARFLLGYHMYPFLVDVRNVFFILMSYFTIEIITFILNDFLFRRQMKKKLDVVHLE